MHREEQQFTKEDEHFSINVEFNGYSYRVFLVFSRLPEGKPLFRVSHIVYMKSF